MPLTSSLSIFHPYTQFFNLPLTLELFERHIYYNTITQNDEDGTRSAFIIKVPTSAAGAADTGSGATATSTSAASTTHSPIKSVLFVTDITTAILDYAKVSPLDTTYKGHDAYSNGASFYQNNLRLQKSHKWGIGS